MPPVDIITAGYPCQPFSNAGKRLGTDDPRHIWPFIAEAISDIRPRLVVLENVAAHLRRGFDVVLSDLAKIGYDARWTVVRASDAGAPHRRERLFVVAYPARQRDYRSWDIRHEGRTEYPDGCQPAADASSTGLPLGHVEHHGPQLAAAERGDREPAADGESVGRDERRTEHAGLQWGPRAADDRGARIARWGDYAGAVERWERILGRAAPEPTVTGARGARVLSPYLTEWMMGLPEGHITGTPGLSRNQMINLAGNGVVPLQAERALWELLT